MSELTAEQKQAKYAASRPKLGAERYRMEDFRIVFRDGTEKVERAIAFAWFVWERGYQGAPSLGWLA